MDAVQDLNLIVAGHIHVMARHGRNANINIAYLPTNFEEITPESIADALAIGALDHQTTPGNIHETLWNIQNGPKAKLTNMMESLNLQINGVYVYFRGRIAHAKLITTKAQVKKKFDSLKI